MSAPNMTPEESRLSVIDKLNLGFGLLAIALLAGSLAISYVPALGQKVGSLAEPMRLGGLGAMVLYVITLVLLKEREVGDFIRHRHTHSGVNIALQVVALIGILSAVCYFGTRHHVRLDLTQNKAYSLSEQTQKVLKDLKDPITVQLFIRKGDPQSNNLETLWRQYAYVTDKVKLEVIDVDREPQFAQQNNITVVGSSLITRGAQKSTITGSQEQDLTTALVKVTREGQKTVYFSIGHGEAAYDKYDKDGLTQLKDAIEKQTYRVDQLALFKTGKVPADASAVLVLGPTRPFSPQELDALDTYIKKDGGRVILSVRPQAKDNLSELSKRYGIIIKNDLVLDTQMNLFNDIRVPVVQKFPYHVITQSMQAAYFPGCRSLEKAAKQPEGVTNIAPLVEGSSGSWGESDLAKRFPQYDAGKDTKGPVALMMLAEMGSKGRLIVSGNTDFVANQSFGQINNGDLFLAAMNWMTGEDSLVSIPPKDPSNKSLNLQPTQMYILLYGASLGFPLLLLLAGALVWWRRR